MRSLRYDQKHPSPPVFYIFLCGLCWERKCGSSGSDAPYCVLHIQCRLCFGVMDGTLERPGCVPTWNVGTRSIVKQCAILRAHAQHRLYAQSAVFCPQSSVTHPPCFLYIFVWSVLGKKMREQWLAMRHPVFCIFNAGYASAAFPHGTWEREICSTQVALRHYELSP